MNITYGIISTASIVPRFMNAVQKGGQGKIIAIASRSLDKAQKMAEDYNIPRAYGTYDELFHDEEINVVYISTINSKHYQYSLEALHHGKNVICEKPFTMTREEAESLFDLAKEKNLFIIEAQKSVFLPVIRRVKEIIQSGQLGDIKLIDFSSSFDISYNTWITSEKEGGGALYTNGSYFIQIIKYLFESQVTAKNGLYLDGTNGGDSQCIITLKLLEHIHVVSKISTEIQIPGLAIIYGKYGRIEIPNYWKARTAKVIYNDGKTEEIHYPCDYELLYEVEHIEKCLEKGLIESPIMNRDMTVETIGLMEDIKKSWQIDKAP